MLTTVNFPPCWWWRMSMAACYADLRGDGYSIILGLLPAGDHETVREQGYNSPEQAVLVQKEKIMKRTSTFLTLLVVASLILAACSQATAAPTLPPTEAPTAVPTAVPTPESKPTEAPTAAATPEQPAPTEAPAPEAPKTLRLPDLDGQTVVAVTGNDYTPLNFVDPLTGEAVGWEYDAVNEICRRLNCVVDWQVSTWDTMISAVREGQFDVGMDGITITDERKQQVDFSIPYMVSQQFMLVRADEARFSTPAEFAADPNLLIGSQTGTTNFYTAVYEILDGDEANPRIKLFENFGAAVQALIAGDVDLVLLDAASSRGYIGANPDQLKLIGDPLGTEEFGFIFTPGSEFLEPFNQAIQSMIEDGFLEHLNARWFFLYDPASTTE
jgi:polar amino acid transport system substrate-binding protein